MSINDYYYGAVYADHRGFNVSLAKVNNVSDPGIIYLVYSVSSSILSNSIIAQTLDDAIDSIDQPNDYMKLEKIVSVVTNQNRSMQASLFKHFDRKKHIQTHISKDISQSLYEIAERLGDGKLIVKQSLVRDIQTDLTTTTSDKISPQVQSLIIVSEAHRFFRSLGVPNQRKMYFR